MIQHNKYSLRKEIPVCLSVWSIHHKITESAAGYDTVSSVSFVAETAHKTTGCNCGGGEGGGGGGGGCCTC